MRAGSFLGVLTGLLLVVAAATASADPETKLEKQETFAIEDVTLRLDAIPVAGAAPQDVRTILALTDEGLCGALTERAVLARAENRFAGVPLVNDVIQGSLFGASYTSDNRLGTAWRIDDVLLLDLRHRPEAAAGAAGGGTVEDLADLLNAEVAALTEPCGLLMEIAFDDTDIYATNDLIVLIDPESGLAPDATLGEWRSYTVSGHRFRRAVDDVGPLADLQTSQVSGNLFSMQPASRAGGPWSMTATPVGGVYRNGDNLVVRRE